MFASTARTKISSGYLRRRRNDARRPPRLAAVRKATFDLSDGFCLVHSVGLSKYIDIAVAHIMNRSVDLVDEARR